MCSCDGRAGIPIARAITSAKKCPAILLDGKSVAMTLRAPAEILPLRLTISEVIDSKPSDFSVITCELVLPAQTVKAEIDGRALPVPSKELKRIVAIADSGCRMKK